MQVADLTPLQIDRLIAQHEQPGYDSRPPYSNGLWALNGSPVIGPEALPYSPSTDLNIGIMLVEREGIALHVCEGGVRATLGEVEAIGPTPLIAGMRAFLMALT